MSLAALLCISFCWGCTALLGKGFPHPFPPERPRTALGGCCPMWYHPLPPSWVERGAIPFAAPLGMQEYNSGSVGHRCLSFPNTSSICGPGRLERPLDVLWHQAEWILGFLCEGPLIWVSRVSTGKDVCWQPQTASGLAVVASVAIGKWGPRGSLGPWAGVPRRVLRCLWLFASLTVFFAREAASCLCAPRRYLCRHSAFPVHLPFEQKCF